MCPSYWDAVSREAGKGELNDHRVQGRPSGCTETTGISGLCLRRTDAHVWHLPDNGTL